MKKCCIWLLLGLVACAQKEQRQRVAIETRYGELQIELYNETPLHRDNFLKNTREGVYEQSLIHRVLPYSYILMGDPHSRPPHPPHEALLGNAHHGKPVPAEINEQFICKKGVLVGFHQGRAANPSLASSGSQFMIIHGNSLSEQQFVQVEAENGFQYTEAQKKEYIRWGGAPAFDRRYTVFGEIVKGMEILDSIALSPASGRLRPLQDIAIRVRVLE